MPYIDTPSRQRLIKKPPQNVGELTYIIYKACRQYLKPEYRYQDLAEVIAALEASKLEFYHRVVRPYEEEKIKESGDVF